MASIKKLWFLLERYTRGTSSFQLVLMSIGLHCLASIILIYLHLSWYLEGNRSKSEPSNLHNRRGGIILSRRSDEVNLIVSHVIDERNISYHGWWFDHHKFQNNIQCFEQKWVKCVPVFSTECKVDGVRAMYHFIPIKRGYPLSSIEISLRSFAPHLSDQTDDGSYGLHALVYLTNGQVDFVRIDFPSNVEGWTKRSANYASPPGTSIVEITVMVFCSGYSGIVSFSDIQLLPLNELKGKQRRNDMVADCVAEAYEDRPLVDDFKYKIVTLPVPELTQKPSSHLITLVTQVSMDRISTLEKTLVPWSGPVSMSIFVKVKSLPEGLKDWQRLYLEKKLRNLHLAHGSNISLILCPEEESRYPINKMRNIAIKMVKTKYMLLLDADFQPSPDLEKEFSSILQSFDTRKKAFVVPAFEFAEAPKATDESPHSKEEFLQLIFRDDPLINPFRIFESIDAHKLTNYWKWYSSSKVYPVLGFSDKYEPYLILENSKNIPHFDERFTGYGMNKVTHTTELFAANYNFMVLPKAWVIHLPHKSSSYNQNFLQNSGQRLRNRAQRFQFIKMVIQKHKVKQEGCN